MLKLQSLIRMGIGSVFVIAAILKLISIDNFEIYIYSFDVLNFTTTTLLSRLLIAGEFIIGLFLILNIRYEIVRKITLIVLIIFSLFLIYVAVSRNDNNCHCFGDIIELNPIESILKNILIIILLTPKIKYSTNDKNLRWHWILIVGSILTVFVVSPPDMIYNKIYSTERKISTIDLYASYDEIEKVNFEKDTIRFDKTAVFGNHNEKGVIAIVSSGCKYCRLGVKKLSMMMERNEIEIDNMNIFIWGKPEEIMRFREETLTDNCDYWHILPNRAIDITYGRFPIFIWMENNEIVRIGDFRDI